MAKQGEVGVFNYTQHTGWWEKMEEFLGRSEVSTGDYLCCNHLRDILALSPSADVYVDELHNMDEVGEDGGPASSGSTLYVSCGCGFPADDLDDEWDEDEIDW